jgi:membrane-bound lytic murein transglycosylase F
MVSGSAQATGISQATGAQTPSWLKPLPWFKPLLPWKERPGVYVLDLLDRVSNGTLDATVANEHEYRLARNFHPELAIAFELRERARLAWLLPRREIAFVERVNQFFKTVQPDLASWLAPHYADPERLDYVGARNFTRHVHERFPAMRSHFQEAGAAYGVDWRLLAAMGYQESKWDSGAVSKTGVRGVMMLQESTAARMGVKDRKEARASIHGGARYFLEVREMVPARIPEPDRTWLALAAYNIGYGHLEDARILTAQQGRSPDRWQDVRAVLPQLTQEHWFLKTKHGYARGYEAARFVDNVRAYLDILEWVAPDPEALATNEIKPTETKGAIKRTPRQGKGQAPRSPSP